MTVIVISLFVSREYNEIYLGEGAAADGYGRTILQIHTLIVGRIIGLGIMIAGFFLRGRPSRDGEANNWQEVHQSKY